MLTVNDDGFKQQILEDTGVKPGRAAKSFSDLGADVKQSVQRIRSSPFIPRTDNVRDFVYESRAGASERSR